MPTTSAAEVIESGDYLEVKFDPATLTVPILRSILLFHKVIVPAKSKKVHLVDSFRRNITANSSKLTKDRKTQLRTPGSCVGIQHGITGEPLQPNGYCIAIATRQTTCQGNTLIITTLSMMNWRLSRMLLPNYQRRNSHRNPELVRS